MPQTLIVELLSDKPLLSRHVKYAEDYFIGLGIVSDKLDGEDFSGFYDWLRESPSSIIGIRYKPFDFPIYAIEKLNNLNYCTVNSELTELYIFFSSKRIFSESISNDAAFGNNIFGFENIKNLFISFNAPENGLIFE